MDIVKKIEDENEKFKVIDFESNQLISSVNISEVAKKFENESTMFNYCQIQGFNEMGNFMSYVYNDIPSLNEIASLPNPDIGFILNYVDSDTLNYKFDLYMNSNDKNIRCVIDKKKLQEAMKMSHKAR